MNFVSKCLNRNESSKSKRQFHKKKGLKAIELSSPEAAYRSEYPKEPPLETGLLIRMYTKIISLYHFIIPFFLYAFSKQQLLDTVRDRIPTLNQLLVWLSNSVLKITEFKFQDLTKFLEFVQSRLSRLSNPWKSWWLDQGCPHEFGSWKPLLKQADFRWHLVHQTSLNQYGLRKKFQFEPA